jgi:putative addiction module CopG family antidote
MVAILFFGWWLFKFSSAGGVDWRGAGTISLPETLKEFIDEQLATRGYGNVSEYFRTLLRAAQEREEDERLEALLGTGFRRQRSYAQPWILEGSQGWGDESCEDTSRSEKNLLKHVIRPLAKDDIIRQSGLPAGGCTWCRGQISWCGRSIRWTYLSDAGSGSAEAVEESGFGWLRLRPVRGFEHIRIYYTVGDDILRVIRILDGRRDIKRILGKETADPRWFGFEVELCSTLRTSSPPPKGTRFSEFRVVRGLGDQFRHVPIRRRPAVRKNVETPNAAVAACPSPPVVLASG